ncbi:MAG TPA: hypothetical protein DDZ81_26190 [Acetobacteraceae bacterium]|jgi:hypothetical protein|nr:hypothetical protein [Acetobacteraceae bacterium]
MSESDTPNLLSRAFDWIKARAARDNELATLSRSDFQRLATDIGVTDSDLRDVVPLIGDHSELMDQMIRARGLDPAQLRRALGPVIRDMEVTCARCRDSRTCRLELETGTAASRSHEFCGNATVIDHLLTTGA